MGEHPSPSDTAVGEIQSLRDRLEVAEETLRAIQHGEVDAILVTDESGERVYTIRSADAPYRALVEQMQEGAATVSKECDIIYANKRFAHIVDVPLERVIGAPLDSVVDVMDRDRLRRLIAEGAGSLRTRFRRAGEPAVDAQISVSRVSVDGIELRTLIVTDLSALTTAQREIRSKDEFLAMLAHELRNPLGAIGGAVDLLALVDPQDVRATHAREVIQRQTVHMAHLVNDLLDVGRVVTGKIALDTKPLDLAESVRACVDAMADSRMEGRILLSVESVWVSADPVRLEQIVGNLVSNALKFVDSDKPVRVSVRAEGADAVFQVTDEGVGIDPSLLPHVFDLFVQADATVDRAKGGLGIGLTLVRRLAELHGGSVDAFSEGVGRGSRFTVRFPAIDPPARERNRVFPSAGAQPMRVLLVDDNADLREMFSLMLGAAGHEVQEAEDGGVALELIRRTAIDVAIVDIGLPGMDGYQLARHIRAEPRGRTLTLVALTGYGFPEDYERSRAAGFDRHLVKPVSAEDLRRELAEIGQRRR